LLQAQKHACKAELSLIKYTVGALEQHYENKIVANMRIKNSVPFSSSLFTALRLLNCFHHDVRSRFADAGSDDDCGGAGWGSPWRGRGVEMGACAPLGMAGENEELGSPSCAVYRRLFSGVASSVWRVCSCARASEGRRQWSRIEDCEREKERELYGGFLCRRAWSGCAGL
jgi:hypothetical protein